MFLMSYPCQHFPSVYYSLRVIYRALAFLWPFVELSTLGPAPILFYEKLGSLA